MPFSVVFSDAGWPSAVTKVPQIKYIAFVKVGFIRGTTIYQNVELNISKL